MTAKRSREWIRLGRPGGEQIIDARRGRVVLERRPSGVGAARGVAFSVRGCQSQDCPCTEVSLDGVVLSKRAHAVSFAGGRITVELDNPGPEEEKERLDAFALTLDLATGEIVVPEGRPAPASLDLDWIRSAMDGALLDRLWELFLEAKGIGGVERPLGIDDVEDWEPGGKVFFNEVFTNSRPDRYRLGDEFVDAADAHCVDPTCRCDTAIVDFIVGAEEERTRPIGFVKVPLRSSSTSSEARHADAVPHRREDLALLLEAYRLYRRRYPSDNRMRTRTERMRDVMRLIVDRCVETGPSSKAARRGRNDPCPCGAGKKFKKCCGAAAPPSPPGRR